MLNIRAVYRHVNTDADGDFDALGAQIAVSQKRPRSCAKNRTVQPIIEAATALLDCQPIVAENKNVSRAPSWSRLLVFARKFGEARSASPSVIQYGSGSGHKAALSAVAARSATLQTGFS